MLLKTFTTLLLPLAVQAAFGEDVFTTSGRLTGKSAFWFPDVTEYLGIRFGQTTAGTNRFMPPKPYFGFGEKVAATKFGPACPQAFPPGYPGAPTATSEDCLFINVWTKSPGLKFRKGKAVILWIYGGAFTTGDSALPLTNGASIANNEDVIVVSFNYRVNVFGFPGAPSLSQLNPGLLDQKLAFDWVRNNIAAFGGDPNKITIYGESAGGSSVDYFAYTWAREKGVHGLIASSGTAMMTGPFSLTRRLDPERGWYALSEKLGCGRSRDSVHSVQCVQGKTVEEVQAAIPLPGGAGVESLVGAFGPTIDNKTIFSDYYARAVEGHFIQKPLLVGTNQNESALFQMLGNITDPGDIISLDNGFKCGAADAARTRARLQIPVWRYFFANNKPGSTSGAFHGDDIPYVFGDGKGGLSQLFQSTWAAFAKDPQSALSKHGWPKYDPQGKTLARIAHDSEAKVDFVQADMYDGTCPPSQIP